VDDGTAKTKNTIGDDIDVDLPEDPPDSSSSEDEEQTDGSSIHDEPPDGAEDLNIPPPTSHNPKSRKPPAWTDPDDATLEVSLASSARLRKLRDAPQEDAVKGPEYERRLRRQFVKMNPTPEWATTASRRKRRRKGSDADADADADADVLTTPDNLDTLLTSSGGILGRKSRARLDPGVLSIERLRDANQAAQAEGEVTTLQFHPSPQVSMLLVASSDRRIRLFNVRVLFLSFQVHILCACFCKQQKAFFMFIALVPDNNNKT
jgi:U3 small nucleolar RNA-associated protein 18